MSIIVQDFNLSFLSRSNKTRKSISCSFSLQVIVMKTSHSASTQVGVHYQVSTALYCYTVLEISICITFPLSGRKRGFREHSPGYIKNCSRSFGTYGFGSRNLSRLNSFYTSVGKITSEIDSTSQHFRNEIGAVVATESEDFRR